MWAGVSPLITAARNGHLQVIWGVLRIRNARKMASDGMRWCQMLMVSDKGIWSGSGLQPSSGLGLRHKDTCSVSRLRVGRARGCVRSYQDVSGHDRSCQLVPHRVGPCQNGSDRTTMCQIVSGRIVTDKGLLRVRVAEGTLAWCVSSAYVTFSSPLNPKNEPKTTLTLTLTPTFVPWVRQNT